MAVIPGHPDATKFSHDFLFPLQNLTVAQNAAPINKHAQRIGIIINTVSVSDLASSEYCSAKNGFKFRFCL